MHSIITFNLICCLSHWNNRYYTNRKVLQCKDCQGTFVEVFNCCGRTTCQWKSIKISVMDCDFALFSWQL